MVTQQINQNQVKHFKQLLAGSDVQSSLCLDDVQGTEFAMFAQILQSHLKCSVDVAKQAVDFWSVDNNIDNLGLSIAATYIAAGAGVKIAKWIDDIFMPSTIFNDLKLPTKLDENEVQAQYNKFGMAFTNTSTYLPVLKELKNPSESTKQLFLALLPLCHPARVKYLVLHVDNASHAERYMEAINRLAFTKITLCQSSNFNQLLDNTILTYFNEIDACNEMLNPNQMHLKSELNTTEKTWNAEVVTGVLSCNIVDDRRNLALFYAAQMIHVSYPETITLSFAVGLAQESLDTGMALSRLISMQEK